MTARYLLAHAEARAWWRARRATSAAAGLGADDRRVLHCLALRGHVVTENFATVAEWAGIAPDRALAALDRLQAEGLVTLGDSGRRDRQRWVLNLRGRAAA